MVVVGSQERLSRMSHKGALLYPRLIAPLGNLICPFWVKIERDMNILFVIFVEEIGRTLNSMWFSCGFCPATSVSQFQAETQLRRDLVYGRSA